MMILILGFFEKTKEAKMVEQGRKMSYLGDGSAGVKMMASNAKKASEFKSAANRQWANVNATSGRAAANEDKTYLELMEKYYTALASE